MFWPSAVPWQVDGSRQHREFFGGPGDSETGHVISHWGYQRIIIDSSFGFFLWDLAKSSFVVRAEMDKHQHMGCGGGTTDIRVYNYDDPP